MNKLLFLLLIPFVVIAESKASTIENHEIANQIIKEYESFREMTSVLKHDEIKGDYYKVKHYPDVQLMWHLKEDINKHEVIRFFKWRENSDEAFAVTYHRSSSIIEGRVVIRRFVGTVPTGWINHTIDYQTGEYLGSQGSDPLLLDSERKILEYWKIDY